MTTHIRLLEVNGTGTTLSVSLAGRCSSFSARCYAMPCMCRLAPKGVYMIFKSALDFGKVHFMHYALKLSSGFNKAFCTERLEIKSLHTKMIWMDSLHSVNLKKISMYLTPFPNFKR